MNLKYSHNIIKEALAEGVKSIGEFAKYIKEKRS